MKVVSTFSGVGGLDLGLERSGMRVCVQAESDEWRRRVLRSHWPDVTIYDDVRDIRRESADLLCGGFPCQDLSIAGPRAGLDGDRSSLFYEFVRLANDIRPNWVFVENVPGLLSSASGRDFAIVLSTLADCGYGLAWRCLDARYFGVAQRRRRVFIVGHLGGEPEPAALSLGTGGEANLDAGKCSWQKHCAGTSRRARANDRTRVAIEVVQSLTKRYGKSGPDLPDTEAGWHVIVGDAVRRLTPIECERLMSWPDGWTAVDRDSTRDTPRYMACGDGVVSNVAEWIGRRIMAVEAQIATA